MAFKMSGWSPFTKIDKPTTLYEYYTKGGGKFPSVKDRSGEYKKSGGSDVYTGSASQNVQLLKHLTKDKGPDVPHKPIAKTKLGKALGMRKKGEYERVIKGVNKVWSGGRWVTEGSKYDNPKERERFKEQDARRAKRKADRLAKRNK